MPDDKKAAKKGGDFLFVNKNAHSSSFSRAATREEAAAINSYAQKRYLDNQDNHGHLDSHLQPGDRATQVRPLKSYVSKVRIDQLTEDAPKRKRRRKKPVKKVDESVEAVVPYAAGRHTPHPKASRVLALPTPPLTEKSDSQSPPLSSVVPISGSGIDPFSRTSLPMGADVLPVLQYYMKFTLVSTFSAHATATLSPTQLAHASAIESIIKGCMNSKAHMYALLAATASRMRTVSGVPLLGSQSPEFFLGKAIGAIREDLTTSRVTSDKQSILDIFYLCVCEWYMHSFDAARTHFGFLRQVWQNVEPASGPFEGYIHDMVSYNDIFLAVETGRPPFLDLKWEPASLLPERMDHIRQSLALQQQKPPNANTEIDDTKYFPTYATAFATTIESGLISPHLCEILEPLPELMQIYHFTLQTTTNCHDELAFLSKKSQALLHRLTSTPAHGAELCIVLALIILMSCMSTSAAWRAGKVNMTRLAIRLRLQLNYEINDEVIRSSPGDNVTVMWTGKDNGLLLWILLTGLFSAGTSPEAEYFASKARDTARLLGLHRSQIEVLMYEHIYLPTLQSEVMEQWYYDSFG